MKKQGLRLNDVRHVASGGACIPPRSVQLQLLLPHLIGVQAPCPTHTVSPCMETPGDRESTSASKAGAGGSGHPERSTCLLPIPRRATCTPGWAQGPEPGSSCAPQGTGFPPSKQGLSPPLQRGCLWWGVHLSGSQEPGKQGPRGVGRYSSSFSQPGCRASGQHTTVGIGCGGSEWKEPWGRSSWDPGPATS